MGEITIRAIIKVLHLSALSCLPRKPSEARTETFSVQKFSADREFYKLSRQGGKQGILQIVISDD